MSDVGNKELKLLISDIQKCTDISTGQKLGEYALYDLVQLGPHDVGVIVRIDSDGAHVLEENGKVRQIKLQGKYSSFSLPLTKSCMLYHLRFLIVVVLKINFIYVR